MTKICLILPFFLGSLWRGAADATDDPTRTPSNSSASPRPTAITDSDRPSLDDLDPPSGPMRTVIERYAADHAILRRAHPIAISPLRRVRMARFNRDWSEMLEKIDFEPFTLDDRVDYLLLKNVLEHDARQWKVQESNFVETAPLLPFSAVILELEGTRRHVQAIDPAKVAGALTELAKQIEKTRKAVDAGAKSKNDDKEKEGIPATKLVAVRAARSVLELKNVLKNWHDFYFGYDPQFTWWAAEPYKIVDKELQTYADFLRERIGGLKPGDEDAIVGDPVGREALLADLASAMIPYSPEELVVIAAKEYAWCEAEMKQASKDLGFGEDWKKAVEHVKDLHVEPGKQPALIRDLAQEAVQFLDEHDLVTIPKVARESWRMEMMSPRRQLVNPFFLGGEVISVSFPTNTMTHEQKMMSMRGNNTHFSRATVHHELIPGHHLQGYMAARHRPYRRLFDTPFLVEGWALYWEILLWDLKFPKTAEDRVGMLFWRMHRCARIVFSLSFHLGKMSPQECIDYLIDKVGHEKDNATAEVRRSFTGNYSPLYQCAYMLGGLQLRALRRELVESDKMTDRAFHDAVLRQNSIPIEMIRASLTKADLKRDFQSSWQFYGADTEGK
jgi:uncharacterized protein (DUF885 family)